MKKFSILIFAAILFAAPVYGADFELKVTDGKGGPVEDAVAALKADSQAETAANAKNVQIIQKDKEFIPRVTIIQSGTSIEFPNRDTVQHHVYSFSQPKHFDIPLYRDTTPKPVLFDKPGVVVLGCNIHDWMKAYIYVTDTPYFSKSGPDGIIKISNIHEGKYKLAFWHPRLKKILGSGLPEFIDLNDKKNFSDTVSVDISVELKKEFIPSRIKNDDSGAY